MTNLLQAIRAIISNPIPDLVNYYKKQGKIRINSVGDALEEYVKDAFANTIHETDLERRTQIHSQLFSWTGNQNNPPDLIIKNGDAVEVKKIESLKSQIALTSAYPKSKLFRDSPMIAPACRDCEDWDVKDIIYVMGLVEYNKLKILWLVYGDCYFADRQFYERLMNRTDLLEVTTLSNFGKCRIDSPDRVFRHCDDFSSSCDFNLHCIVKQDKYLSFPSIDREIINSLCKMENIQVADIDILSPNNPSTAIAAKSLHFRR